MAKQDQDGAPTKETPAAKEIPAKELEFYALDGETVRKVTESQVATLSARAELYDTEAEATRERDKRRRERVMITHRKAKAKAKVAEDRARFARLHPDRVRELGHEAAAAYRKAAKEAEARGEAENVTKLLALADAAPAIVAGKVQGPAPEASQS